MGVARRRNAGERVQKIKWYLTRRRGTKGGTRAAGKKIGSRNVKREGGRPNDDEKIFNEMNIPAGKADITRGKAGLKSGGAQGDENVGF